MTRIKDRILERFRTITSLKTAIILLRFCLELMIFMLPACVGQTHAAQNGAPDLFFSCVDLFRYRQNVIFMSLRYCDDSIRVATQNISGQNSRIADVHHAVNGLELNTVFPCPHRIASAEKRITDFARQMRIAARAIDDGSCDLAMMRDHREDVPPDGSVFSASIVDDDDASLGHLIDKIANRSGRDARRTVEQCIGAACQSKSMVQRLDAETLAGDPQPVKGIA